jgi:hypothetical protein
MKKLTALAATLAVLIPLAAPALAGTLTVKAGDDWFGAKGTRPTITIHKGSAIKWVWVGKTAHNVYAVNSPVNFHSKTKGGKGYTYKHTFTKKGKYTIVCTIHSGMTMVVKVK